MRALLILATASLLGCDPMREPCLSEQGAQDTSRWRACVASCERGTDASCARADALRAALHTPPERAYPADRDGLRALVHDILSAQQAGDSAQAHRLANSLTLRDPDAWFGAHFSPDMARRLVADFHKSQRPLYAMADAIAQEHNLGKRDLIIGQHSRPGDLDSNLLQHLALQAMTDLTPLYTVRLVTPGDAVGFALWSFIHDGQGFRYVGRMAAVDMAPAQDEQEQALRELPLSRVREVLGARFEQVAGPSAQ